MTPGNKGKRVTRIEGVVGPLSYADLRELRGILDDFKKHVEAATDDQKYVVEKTDTWIKNVLDTGQLD